MIRQTIHVVVKFRQQNFFPTPSPKGRTNNFVVRMSRMSLKMKNKDSTHPPLPGPHFVLIEFISHSSFKKRWRGSQFKKQTKQNHNNRRNSYYADLSIQRIFLKVFQDLLMREGKRRQHCLCSTSLIAWIAGQCRKMLRELQWRHKNAEYSIHRKYKLIHMK